MFRRMRSAGKTVCFLSLLCCHWQADAQTPGPMRPPAEVTRQALFSIPFYLNNNGPPPTEVQLYVSGDFGHSWSLYQRRQPQHGKFDFQAGKDGEYWFAVRTSEDRDVPRGSAAVEKIVIIDRVTPELTVDVRIGDSGELVADYRAEDPNLDPRSLRLTYRTHEGEPWQPVPLGPPTAPTAPGMSDDPPSVEGRTSWAVRSSSTPVEVRAEIADRAGNRRQWQDQIEASTSHLSPSEPPVASDVYSSPRDAWPAGPPPDAAAPEPIVSSPTTPPERPATSVFSSDSAESPATPDPTPTTPPRIEDPPATTPFASEWPETPAARSPTTSVAPGQEAPPMRTFSSDWPETSASSEPDPRLPSSTQAADVDAARPPVFAQHPETTSLPWLEDVSPTPPSSAGGWRSSATDWPAVPPSASTVPEPVPGPSKFAGADRPAASVPASGRPGATSQSPQAVELPPAESVTPVLDDYSPPVANRVVPDEPPAGAGVQMTNSRRFNLDYDVSTNGPEAVARVELWITDNQGATWQPYGVDRDLQSPFLVELDREGTYGFRMLIHNQDGSSARPPQPGDTADLSIGLDWTPPRAELLRADVSGEPSTPTVQIHWQAQDDHLLELPVRLSYAPTPQGPWSIIADQLANTGAYTWTCTRPLPARTYLQLEVKDQAGNVASVQLPTPIGPAARGPQGVLRGIRAAAPH